MSEHAVRAGQDERETIAGITTPHVTVAIVSWNTKELLARCLDSLRPEVDSGHAVVTVVDNDSQDGSATMVAKRFPWVRLVRSDSNLGFGPAANVGLVDARTHWIAAANADIELTPGALRMLVDAAAQDSGVGATVPRLENEDGSIQPSIFRFPSVFATLAAAIGLHRVGLGDWIRFGKSWTGEGEADVDWAMGAFILVRRSAFEVIGGFDDQQWMYAEDQDLCWRLQRQGWRVRYVPAARVKHHGGASAIQAFGSATGTPEVVNAHYRWIRRRLGAVRLWLLAGTTIAGLALRVAIYRLLGTLGSTKAEIAAQRAGKSLRLITAATRASRLAHRPAPSPQSRAGP